MEIVIDKETMERLENSDLNACPFLYQINKVKMACVLRAAAKKDRGCVRSSGTFYNPVRCPIKVGETATITIKCVNDTKGKEYYIPPLSEKLKKQCDKLQDSEVDMLTQMGLGEAAVKLNKKLAIEAITKGKTMDKMKVTSTPPNNLVEFHKLEVGSEYWGQMRTKEKADEIARCFNLIDELEKELYDALENDELGNDYYVGRANPEFANGMRRTIRQILTLINKGKNKQKKESSIDSKHEYGRQRDTIQVLCTVWNHKLTELEKYKGLIDTLKTTLVGMIEKESGAAAIIETVDKSKSGYAKGLVKAYQDVLRIIECELNPLIELKQPAIVDGKATRDIKEGEDIWLPIEEYEYIMRQEREES